MGTAGKKMDMRMLSLGNAMMLRVATPEMFSPLPQPRGKPRGPKPVTD
jgi:hypothetical protein